MGDSFGAAAEMIARGNETSGHPLVAIGLPERLPTESGQAGAGGTSRGRRGALLVGCSPRMGRDILEDDLYGAVLARFGVHGREGVSEMDTPLPPFFISVHSKGS
jgi:hypothetical protein